MKWFVETFLPSLEERYLKSGKLWLTKKQVAVCTQYMDYGALRGQREIKVEDKKYCIQIAPNGCASFYIVNCATGFCIYS